MKVPSADQIAYLAGWRRPWNDSGRFSTARYSSVSTYASRKNSYAAPWLRPRIRRPTLCVRFAVTV